MKLILIGIAVGVAISIIVPLLVHYILHRIKVFIRLDLLTERAAHEDLFDAKRR